MVAVAVAAPAEAWRLAAAAAQAEAQRLAAARPHPEVQRLAEVAAREEMQLLATARQQAEAWRRVDAPTSQRGAAALPQCPQRQVLHGSGRCLSERQRGHGSGRLRRLAWLGYTYYLM